MWKIRLVFIDESADNEFWVVDMSKGVAEYSSRRNRPEGENQLERRQQVRFPAAVMATLQFEDAPPPHKTRTTNSGETHT